MERFWDERAREDAFFFVDSRLEYRKPDVERFWAEGKTDLEHLLTLMDVAVGPGDVAVDIGCGLGRLTRALAARGAEVWAIDVSSEMLARAQELNTGLDSVRWVHGDGTSLAGIPDGVADCCVSHVVFQHIPDQQVVLGYVREMGRVLKPSGWSMFQVSDDATIHAPKRVGLLARLLRRAPRGRDHPAWLGARMDLGELRATAAAAGLDVEQIEGEGTQYCIVLARRRA
jgi:SAM-dependent methyltransferase